MLWMAINNMNISSRGYRKQNRDYWGLVDAEDHDDDSDAISDQEELNIDIESQFVFEDEDDDNS